MIQCNKQVNSRISTEEESRIVVELMVRAPRSLPLSGQLVRLSSQAPHLRLSHLGVANQLRMSVVPGGYDPSGDLLKMIEPILETLRVAHPGLRFR